MQSIHLLLGQRVGRYTLRRLLDRRGTGALFLAEPATGGPAVLFKTLNDELASQPRAAGAFFQTAQLAAGLQHPNIARIIEVDRTQDGLPYLVMERADGVPLGQLVPASKGIHPREALPLLERICVGLEAAHQQGVWHLGLEPENVLVQPGEPPGVLLLNFGMARVLLAARQPPTQGLPFAAPELLQPNPAPPGAAADLFSVGAMIHWMLCGALPHGANGCLSGSRGGYQVPRLLSELRPKIPIRAAELVQRCMAFDPGQRPASPARLHEQLVRTVTYAPVRGLGDLASRLMHLKGGDPAPDRGPDRGSTAQQLDGARHPQPVSAGDGADSPATVMALPILEPPPPEKEAARLPPRIPAPPPGAVDPLAADEEPTALDAPTIKELPLLQGDLEHEAADDAPTVRELPLLEGALQQDIPEAPCATIEELTVLDELPVAGADLERALEQRRTTRLPPNK